MSTGALASSANDTIKVGVLHSLSGTMSISENPVKDATLLAIAEINFSGGVLGKKLSPVIEDGASDLQTFAQKAWKLLEQDRVAVVFGCWTSASRKAVLPVFERLNGLLFYPVQYEGLEQSPNIFYTGAAPNQQIIPAVDYLLARGKKKIFLLGSDYIFPRTANKIVKAQLRTKGAELVGEEYIPLGADEVGPIISKIEASEPDAIFNTLNGDSNIAFFEQFKEAGFTSDRLPVMSVSVAEAEIRAIGAANMLGHLVVWNYFQTVETPENQKFVATYKAVYGHNRVTSDPIEAGYFGVYLWKLAVEKAGSFAIAPVRAAAKRVEFRAPQGLVKIDGRSQHTWKTVRIGFVRSDGLVDEIWNSGQPVRPDPFLTRYEWAADLNQGGWQLSIRHRLNLLFIALVAITFLAVGVEWLALDRVTRMAIATDIAGTQRVEVSHLTLIAKAYHNQPTCTNLTCQVSYAEMQQAIANFDSSLTALKSKIKTPQISNQNILATLQKLEIEWPIYRQLLQDYLVATPDKENQYLKLMDNQARILGEALDVAAKVFEKQAAANASRSKILVLAALLLTVLAMGGAFLVVARIATALSQVTQTAELLVSGDLTARASVVSGDEIGVLSSTLNTMAEQVRSLLKGLEVRGQKLEERTQEAEAANRAKSAFLANMSHELRTPLNAILGYSEILREDAKDLGLTEFVSDLESIHVAGKHLLSLIGDILDISKIEAEQMTLYQETFNIRELIDEIAIAIQPLIEKNGNTLRVEYKGDIGNMHCDLVKVRQVLLNLLSNAAKFTENGKITLTIEKGEVRSVKGENIETSPFTLHPSHFISFSVTDTGIGISEEQMQTIFLAFTQADVSTTRKYGGTGLGLAISERFCQMMGGKISVQSELGKGSTFTVCLPAQYTPPQELPIG